MTMKEVALDLRVSQYWLQQWLVVNPVDEAGVPFYVRTGRRQKFEHSDIERILNHMRKLEALRLGPSIKSKIRIMDLMSQVGGTSYEQLLQLRKGDKRSVSARRPKRDGR